MPLPLLLAVVTLVSDAVVDSVAIAVIIIGAVVTYDLFVVAAEWCKNWFIYIFLFSSEGIRSRV